MYEFKYFIDQFVLNKMSTMPHFFINFALVSLICSLIRSVSFFFDSIEHLFLFSHSLYSKQLIFNILNEIFINRKKITNSRLSILFLSRDSSYLLSKFLFLLEFSQKIFLKNITIYHFLNSSSSKNSSYLSSNLIFFKVTLYL